MSKNRQKYQEKVKTFEKPGKNRQKCRKTGKKTAKNIEKPSKTKKKRE